MKSLAISAVSAVCARAIRRLWSARKLLVEVYWSLRTFVARVFRPLATNVLPFWHHLVYLLLVPLIGSLAVQLIGYRKPDHSHGYLDVLFMCVSSMTVSGLNTVELEEFSTGQIMVLTILMLAGSEAFVSGLNLLFGSWKMDLTEAAPVMDDPETATLDLGRIDSAVELARSVKRQCVSVLVDIVFVYVFAFLFLGSISIALYLRFNSYARNVLSSRGIPLIPFAIHVAVSSFCNGGLIWTKENMGIFSKNSSMLLIIVVLVFAGNTLLSSLLRVVVFVLYKLTRREEYRYMLRNPEKLSFPHLQPRSKTLLVAASLAGLWALQLLFFLSLEWGKSFFDGLSWFEKLVNGMFLATNSRHCGEISFDLSQVSTAVGLVVMIAMCLPAYSHLDPSGEERREMVVSTRDGEAEKGPWRWLRISSMPQPLYIAVFVLLACLIERKNIASDPLNFSFFFVAFEVISAYGNVGLSTGYGCSRRLDTDGTCTDLWISLTGKWSNGGKILIMFVMLFGRLKKFHLKGGKSWKLH